MTKMSELFQRGYPRTKVTIDEMDLWIPALPIPYQGLNLRDAWEVLWGRATAIKN